MKKAKDKNNVFQTRRSFMTNAVLGSEGLTLASSGVAGCSGIETEKTLKAGFL